MAESLTPLEKNTQALAEIKKMVDGLPEAGGGTDISLGITSATVGDIVKVKAVDGTGKPTDWIPVGSRLVFEQTTTEEVNIISYSPPAGYWVTDYIVEVTTPKWEGGTANTDYHVRGYRSGGGLLVKNGLRPTMEFTSKTFLLSPHEGNDFIQFDCVTQSGNIFQAAFGNYKYTQYVQVYTSVAETLFPVGTKVKIYARIVTEAEKNANL